MDPPSQSLRRDETTNCRQDRENSPTADERRYTQIGFRRPPITFHLSPFTSHCPIATHHHCAFANSWLAYVLGRRLLGLGSAERFCHRAVRCSYCRVYLSAARCATWLVTP